MDRKKIISETQVSYKTEKVLFLFTPKKKLGTLKNRFEYFKVNTTIENARAIAHGISDNIDLVVYSRYYLINIILLFIHDMYYNYVKNCFFF